MDIRFMSNRPCLVDYFYGAACVLHCPLRNVFGKESFEPAMFMRPEDDHIGLPLLTLRKKRRLGLSLNYN
jgi:hypothetical protein